MCKYLLIREEYGYRYWITECNKEQAQKIKEWWLKLPTVLGMFFNPQNTFPLPLVELTADNEDKYQDVSRETVSVYIEIHEDDDSSLKIIGDQTYYHAGYKNYSN